MKYSPRRPARRLAPGDFFLALYPGLFCFFLAPSEEGASETHGAAEPRSRTRCRNFTCPRPATKSALTSGHPLGTTFPPCAVGPRPCGLPLCKAPRIVPGRSDEAAPRARAKGSTGGKFGSVGVRGTQGSRAPAGLRARRSPHVFPGILHFCDC